MLEEFIGGRKQMKLIYEVTTELCSKGQLAESCGKLREEKQHLKENYDESVKGR